jgi:hypothetical protein
MMLEEGEEVVVMGIETSALGPGRRITGMPWAWM